MSELEAFPEDWDRALTEEPTMAFHPYLNFNGTCREAFTRYQEIFGGELYILGADDMPADESVTPDWNPDMVVHAALTMGGDMLLASDAPGFGACADRWGTLWMVSAPSDVEMPG